MKNTLMMFALTGLQIQDGSADEADLPFYIYDDTEDLGESSWDTEEGD